MKDEPTIPYSLLLSSVGFYFPGEYSVGVLSRVFDISYSSDLHSTPCCSAFGRK
jgi:hypothetical protein